MDVWGKDHIIRRNIDYIVVSELTQLHRGGFIMNESTIQYKRSKGWQLALSAAVSAVPTLFVILMTFASYIATGAYGATSILAGTIISGSRIFDGLTDPIIGLFADRFNSRFGRSRPMIVLGFTILSFSVLSMFVFFTSSGSIIVFMLIYIVYIIGYTIFTVGANMVPPIMTNDPKQRPIMGRWLSVYVTVIGSMISVVLAATLMPRHNYKIGIPLLNELAFIIVGISALMVLTSIIAVTLAKADTREAYVGKNKERVKFSDMWDLLRHNRALQMYTVAAASDKLALQTAGQSVINVMIFGILIGNYKFYGTLTFINMFVSLAIIFFASKLAGNQGLKKSLIMWTRIAMGMSILMFLYMNFVDTLQISINPLLKITFITLFCLVNATKIATSCVTDPIRADVIDYELSRSGRYMPAIINTTYSFIDKMISSLASTIIAFSVAAIGFTNAMPQATDLLTKPLFFTAIFLWLGMPVIGWICTLIAMKFYPLDKEAMVNIQIKNNEIRAIAGKES